MDLDRYSLDSKTVFRMSEQKYFYVTNTWGRVGLGFRKNMSLNIMSLIAGWKTIWGTASSPLKGTLRDHFLREKETFRGLISKQKGTSKKNYCFRETL